MKIKIKKIHPESVIPTYSKEGDAGLDLTAIEKKECKVTNTINYRTGISIAIPQGHYGQIQPRSSVYTTGLTLVNSPAIIDSGYRGEIVLRFRKTSTKGDCHEAYEAGERIAQLIILPYPKINFVEVDELGDTERGEGGFGSTGK